MTTPARIEELQNQVAALVAIVQGLADEVGDIDTIKAKRKAKRDEAARIERFRIVALPPAERNAILSGYSAEDLREFLRAAGNAVQFAIEADPALRERIKAHLTPGQIDQVALALTPDDDLPRPVFLVVASETTDANCTRRWRTTGGRREIDATQAARLTELGLGSMVSYRGASGAPQYLAPPLDPGDRIELPSREAAMLIVEMSGLDAARDRGDLRIEDGTLEQRRAAWLGARGGAA